MIQKTLLSILLLTLAVGPVVALEPEPAEDAVALAKPELAAETLELTGMLNDEAPLMSLEPERTEVKDAALPSVLSWPRGIRYPNTCLPCKTNDDCLLGDRCVFGVFCP